MLRKFSVLGLFAILALTSMPLGGCQTGGMQPSALRGDANNEQTARYTDDKGHFHPELWGRGQSLR